VIRNLKLARWRSYESAEISFDQGTTFIVAANGIGKSSLLEAAQFALTGKASGGGTPVMLGKDDATVTLTLDLGSDDLIQIERTIAAAQSLGSEPRITREGGELTPDQFAAELRRAFDATPEFVAHNAFLYDIRSDTGILDLRTLLDRAYQLDTQRTLAEQLRATATSLETEAKQLSSAVRTESKIAGRLEEELAAARTEQAAAEEALRSARTAMDAASQARDTFVGQLAVAERTADWNSRYSELVAEAGDLVTPEGPEQLADQVLGLVSEAEVTLTNLQGDVAATRARLESIEAAIHDLHTAGAECPVCRRPLDDEVRALAETAQRSDADALREHLDAIDMEPTRTRLEALRGLLRKVDALGRRPDEPQSDQPLADAQPGYERALIALEQAVSAHEAAKARVNEVAAAADEARASDEASDKSERAWRRYFLTSAAASALFESIDDEIRHNVEPVQELVAERWNGLFPDRPDLQFDLDGRQWREVNNLPLPFESFSTGEQVAARLIMQVAILTAATSVDFCWFDEPLEHLDPRTRRLVAGMLSDGRRATGLSQVVVTTYEEELAAHLARTDDATKIEYVRAGPMSYPPARADQH
jgi:DNA repair exonuclease SbcCD ATPase subunit